MIYTLSNITYSVMSIIINIKRYINIENIKLVVFYLAVLFLPINLFAVSRPAWSYLNGVFIDYWAPKLYVSSLLIWLLWLLNYYQITQKVSAKRLVARGKTTVRLILTFFGLRSRIVLTFGLILMIIGRSFTTDRPLASLLFLLGWLTGPGLLLLFWSQNRTWVQKHLSSAVIGSVLLQAFLAWYQFFFQKSLGPYWLFGEPVFRASSFLATSDFWPMVRSLPYGSTPHPNILAAWMVVGVVYAWTQLFKKKHLSIGILLLIIIFFSTIVITESITALASLPLLFILYHQRRNLNTWLKNQPKIRLILPVAFIILGTLVWQAVVILGQNYLPAPSFIRRADLLKSSCQAWPHWIIWGEGLNQNVRLAANANIALFQGRFLQPIHSSLLSLVIDLGIGTIILLLSFSFSVNYLYSFYLILLMSFVPIFSLDHFAVSLLTGSYILILISIFFYHHSVT